MIYNFNLGIGWASSGVEYAQAYRASIFRKIGVGAKFVFTDMFSTENIEHMTQNIGFLDSEVIWLYSYFTDFKIAPVSYTLRQLEKTFSAKKFMFSRNGKTAKYIFEGNNNFYTVHMVDDKSDKVHRVEIVSRGYLIRKDYYTYGRLYSEYYAPLDNKAHLYLRRFFNENGSIAYEEIIDDDRVVYKFKDKLLMSKNELVGELVKGLKLKEDDIVIIDRFKEIGATILRNVYPARVGNVVHADHFSESSTDDDYILWNNYYEYPFAMSKHLSFLITSTEAQKKLMEEQFKKYTDNVPNIVAIPVGSIDELKYPSSLRKKHSLITASRLANEKHIDWIVEAVVEARKVIGDVTLDIYGKGGEESKLSKLIEEKKATDYIKLMGQHNLNRIYINYEAYIAGSTSEGFGLTLLEAVGSGLPIIGFNVRYGNPTFVDDGKNGYLIDINDEMDSKAKINELSNNIIKLFTEADLSSFHEYSYMKAEKFLTKEVEKKWEQLLI